MGKTLTLFILTTLSVTGCGGSGGSSGAGTVTETNAGGSPGAVQFAYNACESTYYRGVIGSYRGELEYQVVSLEDEVVRSCVYEFNLQIQGSPIAVTLPGQPITSDGCRLNGSYQGTVDQEIIWSIDDPNAYQCIAPQGSLSISDPFGSTVNPEIFFENVEYPVSIGISGPVIVERQGPYFGDTDVIVPYQHLLGGQSPIASFMRIDGIDELTLLDNSILQQTLTSSLVKE